MENQEKDLVKQKLEAEIQKLNLETKELEKGWFRKNSASFVSSLIVFATALVTLWFAYENNFFETKSIDLNIRKTKLEIDIHDFQHQKDSLKNVLDSLVIKIDTINAQLNNKELEKAGIVKRFSKTIYEQSIPRVNFDIVEIYKSFAVYNYYSQDLIDLIRKNEVQSYRSKLVRLLIDSTEHPPLWGIPSFELQVKLYLVLYKVTGEKKWKDTLFNSSIWLYQYCMNSKSGFATTGPQYFEGKWWSAQDRLDFCLLLNDSIQRPKDAVTQSYYIQNVIALSQDVENFKLYEQRTDLYSNVVLKGREILLKKPEFLPLLHMPMPRLNVATYFKKFLPKRAYLVYASHILTDSSDQDYYLKSEFLGFISTFSNTYSDIKNLTMTDYPGWKSWRNNHRDEVEFWEGNLHSLKKEKLIQEMEEK